MEKERLFQGEYIFVCGKGIELRILGQQDKRDYIRTMGPMPTAGDAELAKKIKEEAWQGLNSHNNIAFAIFDIGTGEYLGYCEYKHIHSSSPDIGIVLLPEHQHKGVGYTVCKKMIDLAFSRTAVPALYYKVERGNKPSIALAEKLGARLFKTELLYEQLLSSFKLLDPEELEDKAIQRFMDALSQHSEELSKREYDKDILIYKISRD